MRDGTPEGTKVFSPGGELLSMITHVEWSVGVNNFAAAKVTFHAVELDVVGVQS